MTSSRLQVFIKNIEINWDFVKKQGIYGKEIDNETFQLAVSNMLISTGHVFDALENGDSIREPIKRKFDSILANPPFGIKGFDYDSFTNANNYAYTPIKSKNAVSLFLQAIIHMLNTNGKCAIVLPDGQDLFSKSAGFVNIRKFLMKTCSLEEVIYLPSGMFEYTSIKTCIFYFVKKIPGDQALTVKRNKTNTYSFCKEHQTTSVKFYEYDLTTKVKNLLIEVSITDLEANKYALNYIDYVKPEKVIYNNKITVKTLGEICEFNIGGTPLRAVKEYYEGGSNIWVSIRDLKSGYIYDSKEKITDLGVKKSNVKLFLKDTVLFSFKLSIGKTAIAGTPLYKLIIQDLLLEIK